MAEKRAGFWVGPGIIGPGIKYGDPIFEGVLDTKTIEAQKKLGYIQDFEVSDEAQENLNAADLILKALTEEKELLKKQVAELEAELKTQKTENKKLKKAAK